MTKAYLEIEMPDCCENCLLFVTYEAGDFSCCGTDKYKVIDYDEIHKRQEWCPLISKGFME
jgi:hypothetical protein